MTLLQSSTVPVPSVLLAVKQRVAGPGGLYNLGNLFGLVTGLGFYLAATPAGVGSVLDYFVGNGASVLMTLAMLVFFWSGEVYHRAFNTGGAPDFAAVRRGDILSGWGALLLGLGLMALGHPVLAAGSGLLHAVGKFGSGMALPKGWWPQRFPDLWRTMVLISRFPAVAAAFAALWQTASHGSLMSPEGLAPTTLLLCYWLWLKADVILLRTA